MKMMEKTVTQLAHNRPQPKPAPPQPQQQQTASLSNPNYKLSATQEDAVRRTIGQCWNIDAGAQDYRALEIEMRITLTPDAVVTSAEVLDRGRYFSDSRYRAAADAARRAVLNDKCHKLPLPLDQYADWRTIKLVFSPEGFLQ
jgi:hypothetical protein